MADQPTPPPSNEPQSTPPSESPAPQTPPSMDWRVIGLVALAALLLLAVYINRRFYGKGSLKMEDRPEAAQGGPEAQPAGPPPTPAQQYAMLVQRREIEAFHAMFVAGERTYLLGMPSTPYASNEEPRQLAGVRPGRLFDVTRRVAGIEPQMLHRRGMFGSEGVAFMNTFPPLGFDSSVRPAFKPAGEITTDLISDHERVIGLRVGNEARAYPIKFANYHEVINDTVGGVPVVVAWSALADAAKAFERPAETPFGSAGLLFQTGIVLFDRQTQSLWSALMGKCLAGAQAGAALKPLPVVTTTWQAWRRLHPESSVLVGAEPPLPLNYEANPATPPGYLGDFRILYPIYGYDVSKTPMRFKMRVFGVVGPEGKGAKAYEWSLLAGQEGKPFEDTIAGVPVTVQYDPNTDLFSVKSADGAELFSEAMLWLAWVGIHPESEVWQEETLRAMIAPAQPAVPEMPQAETPPQETPGAE